MKGTRMNEILRRALRPLVQHLLKLGLLQLSVLFVTVAVLVSMAIVLVIDLAWDGRFNAELEFAGVVTPFLDGLLIVGLLAAVLGELREEVARRKAAESSMRELNAELEAKVEIKAGQLLEAQEKLVRKEKLVLLGQVADTVGHELRNPLGVMNNAVYYLQAVLPNADETTKEYLGIIKDEIGEAERIVSDLLDAVRTKPPRQEAVDVADVLRQTLRKCDIPASVSVRLDIPQTPPLVRVDPMHLHQVFWNLITNAVEAMPEGGALEIQAAEAPQALRISIRDSGIGIAPEQLDKVFEPLFTTKARRVGLGLVVVKKLMQANGGSVAVESEPGKGSVFTVTLPVGG